MKKKGKKKKELLGLCKKGLNRRGEIITRREF